MKENKQDLRISEHRNTEEKVTVRKTTYSLFSLHFVSLRQTIIRNCIFFSLFSNWTLDYKIFLRDNGLYTPTVFPKLFTFNLLFNMKNVKLIILNYYFLNNDLLYKRHETPTFVDINQFYN